MACSWSEYRLFMGGRFVTGVRGVKYKASQDKVPIYGEGNEVLDYGYGNKKYEGEITLLQNELEALIASSPNNDPLSLKFTIVHSYVPSKGIGRIITDVCEDCEFLEIEKAMSQGDTFMEITIPLIIKKIKLNTTSI